MKKRLLVACEYSGIVREAFKEFGWDAWSCDLLDTDIPGQHIKDDVLLHLDDGWDMMIGFPPCVYLCVSGIHWNKRRPEREQLTHEAILFFMSLVDANIPKICIENPVGVMSTHYRKPDQWINHYDYGENASKKTGLWLKNLPKLVPNPKEFVFPRTVYYNGKAYKRWANQTDSGQNKLAPSEDRWKIRSLTPKGLAKQMAIQWGNL